MHLRLLLSKQAPLRVHLNLEDLPDISRSILAINLLGPHLHRLERLVLTIPCSFPLPSALFSEDLPRLSFLRLRVTFDERPLDATPIIIAHPSLKHVYLDFSESEAATLSKYYAGVALNATFLRLALAIDHKFDLLDILEQAPHLEELELIETVETSADYERTAEGSLVLPRLKSLILLSCYGLDVFSRIQFPLLETLTIEEDHYGSEFASGRTHTFPKLRHIFSKHSRTTLDVIPAFGHHLIRSLNLVMDSETLPELTSRLTRASNSFDGYADAEWSSLVSLTLLVTPDMAVQKDRENRRTHIQNLVLAILPRTELNFTASVERKTEGELKDWIEETKKLLGDRFSWVYHT